MAEDDELTVEQQIDNLDAALTALIELLVEKKVLNQKQFDDKVDSFYEP